MFHSYDSGRPNRAFTLFSYRRLAEGYDRSCRLIGPIRRRTIERLAFRPGEAVIDVASGTGLSLPMLSTAVGTRGRVIAIELCPEMALIASQRIAALSLGNATQIVAPIEETGRVDLSQGRRFAPA